MKRISNYSFLEDDLVVLENGSRWSVPPARRIDVTFWRYGDPVLSEDYQPGGFIENLSTKMKLPAEMIEGPEIPDPLGPDAG